MRHSPQEADITEPREHERTADVFSPVGSPAVLNIIDYRFGSSPKATRPDTVVRFPAAALLLQHKGQLLEHTAPGQRLVMPKVALLGPTDRAHIWETAPGTHFTLVNLAPGTAQALLGIDPRDLQEQVESLAGHALSDLLIDPELENAAGLHDRLCHIIDERCESDWRRRRTRKILLAIRNEQFGNKVRNYADHFGITPRTLQRIVSKAVGLTTKQMLTIQRARRMITLTGPGWKRSIAQLAQESGYYDQSHMRYDLERMGLGSISQHTDGDHIITEP